MTYEWNRDRTQRNFLYQGRHYRDVGFGNGNSWGRSMIFGPRTEPNHHLQEYIAFPGDDADFIQPLCINTEDEEEPCTRCGTCEEKTFACSEDEYEMEE